MKNKTYFISGIDTDCGKTYITGNLAKLLQSHGKKVITHKLIQTGCAGISEDVLEHRRIMGVDLFPEDKSGITCPYVLSFPASPHLACEIDKLELDFDSIKSSISALASKYEIVLCEGAGGLMVPLKKDYLTIDFIKENNYPVILVSSSKLGSINHTILSLQACKSYGIDLKYVIYNEFPDQNKLISEDSYKYLKSYVQSNFTNVEFFRNENLDQIKL
ncbi:MAG: ATP-dependent dethiobiotin synthetase BioD [Salinivirgaceae bacterium]|nr:ATP-dependent dethiobiotin synthetase BioD [Salinivirgaceae bacterium]